MIFSGLEVENLKIRGWMKEDDMTLCAEQTWCPSSATAAFSL
jgi:hypothetical protein